MSSLQGKVAIVTGAASGIGKACAEVFAERGAQVVVSDLVDTAGEEVARAIVDEGGDARFVACDISKSEQVEALIEETDRAFGGLDIAVNNAGIRGELVELADTSNEHWRQVIDVNLTGTFFCMKAEIEAMLEEGGGSIVNVASVAGQVGFAGVGPYTAAKHGLVGVTRTAALEYSKKGIRVNAIGPGVVETPMVQDMTGEPEGRQQLLDAHPIGRFGTPREVGELIAFLGGDEAGFITGSFIPIDGGYLAQ